MSPSRFLLARIASIAAGFAALTMTISCTVGPNYTAPDTTLAGSYKSAEKPKKTDTGRIVPAAEAPERWWAVFEDPELNSLIERALRGNRDLQQAVSHLRQTRAERATIVSRLLPEVDLTGGYNRGHGSKNVQLPFGAGGGGGGAASGATASRNSDSIPDPAGVRAQQSDMAANSPSPSASAPAAGQSRPGGPTSPFGEGGLPGVTTNLYQVGFDATWELDFFGGSRRALEAANASVDAATEAGRALMTTLLAEVAETYVQLRGVQQQRDIAESNIAAQRDLKAIAEAKRQAGLGGDLEVARQTAELAAQEAALPALESTERKMAHALAFLIGENPETLLDELAQPQPLPDMPPRIPIGVPSDLLRRRPDIRQAERELAAATAEVGVATAQLFPSFSLTGAVGLDSSDLRHLPDWSSHYYSISPGIRWPLLNWGRVRASIRIQNEVQGQAFLRYQSRVAQSLREVEDALVQFQAEQTRRESLARAVTASRDAWSLARQSYEQGAVDETAILDARRVLLQAESTLAQSDASLRTDLIALYKALGGGWQI